MSVTKRFRGAWPTMITPFKPDLSIDFDGVDALTEWYLEQGVDGIFALCQSSEMFFLSREESIALVRRVLSRVRGRVPVVVSGHVADDIAAQTDTARALWAEGPAAVVLLTNRSADKDEDESAWTDGFSRLLDALPADMALGVYECPYPHPRFATTAMMRTIAADGRFVFFKDTCCQSRPVADKIAVAKGTALSILNANAALLLETLRMGADGYCGVMGNIHPKLYAHLCAQYDKVGNEAAIARLSDFLSVTSAIETRVYPVCAKYALSRRGLPIGLHTRSKDASAFIESYAQEMDSLLRMSAAFESELA